MESLIIDNTNLANEPLSKIVNDYEVISILQPLSRDETTGSAGGGTMYQSYVWTEKKLSCFEQWLPLSVRRLFLDIGSWRKYEDYTDPYP